MTRHSVGRVILRVLAVMGILLGVVFFYALLHEGGHALLVLLFGGTITEFEINLFRQSPHISYVGVIDPMQRALISLGGPVLPLVLVLPLTLLLRKTRNIVVQGVSLSLLASLLPAVIVSAVISLAYGFGAVQINEDIAKFLFYSGLNPFAVAVVFLVLFVAILVFLLKVGRVKDVAISVGKAMRGSQDKRLPLLVGKVLVVLLLVIGTGILPNKNRRETPVSQPLTYHTKIDVNLADVKPDATLYHTFGVEEPTTFDFVYSLDTHSDITLRLVNLGGEPFVFNNQDTIVMFQGSGSLSLAYFAGFTLLEGDYALEVSPGGFGSLTMHIDSKKPDAADQQYLELLTKVNEGTFTADSYKEQGYELIYEGKLALGSDQLLLSVPSIPYERKVSAFVVGEGEVSLYYVADGETHTLLEGFRATTGRGLPLHRSPGEFRATVVGPSPTLYIYLNFPGQWD